MKKKILISVLLAFCLISGIYGCVAQDMPAVKKQTPAAENKNSTAAPDFGPYMREVQRKVKSNWNPPQGNTYARTVVLFSVERDGKIINPKVISSSGIKGYDEAALEAIKASSPARPLPAAYKGPKVDIQFTLDYKVHKVPNLQGNSQNKSNPPLKNAVANNYVSSLFYFEKASRYSDAGEHKQAILYYTKAIEINPEKAVFYIGRGSSYCDNNEHEKAIADYTTAIKLNPEESKFYATRAYCYSEIGQYDKAIADATKAIELAPKNGIGYNNRAFAYYAKKDYTKAIADYTRAIELNQNRDYLYHNRGCSYMELKQYDNAIKDFQKAVQLNSNVAEYYESLANAYDSVKDYKKAVEYHKKADKLKKQED